ncbi:hypothetical protein BDR26DRAFT_513950 [Obelidium mucronatum]|nr:hypothetical protein BDR26DRAFT_513950 [Obelidium mucronatum]
MASGLLADSLLFFGPNSLNMQNKRKTALATDENSRPVNRQQKRFYPETPMLTPATKKAQPQRSGIASVYSSANIAIPFNPSALSLNDSLNHPRINTSYDTISRNAGISIYANPRIADPQLADKATMDSIIKQFETLDVEGHKTVLQSLLANIPPAIRSELLASLVPEIFTSDLEQLAAVSIETPTVDNRLDVSKMLEDWDSEGTLLYKTVFTLTKGEKGRLASVLSIFLNSRSQKYNYLQSDNAIVLYMGGASENVIQLFSAYGLSVSYSTVYDRLDAMASQILARVPVQYEGFKRAWIFDNVERSFRVHQKSTSNQTTFQSHTLRGHFEILDCDTSLSSTTPKIDINVLTPADLLASESDITWLRRQMVLAVANEIIKSNVNFQHLPIQLEHPKRPVGCVGISPLKISPEREMTTDGAIKILSQFGEEFSIPKDGLLEVLVVGDGGTITNIRSAIHERRHDSLAHDSDRLSHIKPALGEFHMEMAIVRGTWEMFGKGRTMVQGSLGSYAYLKDKSINGNKFKFFDMRDAQLETMRIYLEVLSNELLESALFSSGENTLVKVLQLSEAVVATLDSSVYIPKWTPSAAVKPKNQVEYFPQLKIPFENYRLQFIKHVLKYVVFRSCIHHGDGYGVISMHRLYLPFLKLYSKGYCHLVLQELIELESKISQQCRHVSVQNRFCNPKGHPSTFHAADLEMEHHVRAFKAKEDTAGSNKNWNHTVRVSITASTANDVRKSLFRHLDLRDSSSEHQDSRENCFKRLLDSETY